MSDIGLGIESIVRKEATTGHVAVDRKDDYVWYRHIFSKSSYAHDKEFLEHLGAPEQFNGKASHTYDEYKNIVHEIPRLKVAYGSELKSFILTAYVMSAVLGTSILCANTPPDNTYTALASAGTIGLFLAGTIGAIGAYRAKRHYNMIKKEVKEKKQVINAIRSIAKANKISPN